eukprot:CAMPEP_0197832446 /NCGR_PEP_ID=MMETSP1437-20131217/14843_1 /TAXON_ID=49252 ORGANISM="Eucampia antarctica, Strain CCMP1452" /NCGR_SAMPLE_ID=MMETSP1437 /ASSEMBLY_ACC=CAM_ASM_001096 /LENGTH=309 /DNA_ID=CAMNT_0043435829 /DNA_START=198 /DNA_END=1123 /DNA_ORIENTATION=+
MTPKGQMSTSGSGPAIMMMPPHIRATFMPDPPVKLLPPPNRKRPKAYVDNSDDNSRPKLKGGLSGVAQFMAQFERGETPQRKEGPTPASIKAAKVKNRQDKNSEKLAPSIEAYKLELRDCQGEFQGMNCYNTLFVGRLAYEVTERKLLREFESSGPIKDLKLVVDKVSRKSRGFAFVEYEHEEDMKRAYRAADGMRVEGREVVVDVERGHTVPNWLPRRLGGGLGGTRLGGADKNITITGRFDPSKPNNLPPPGYGPGPVDDQRHNAIPPSGGSYNRGGPMRGPPPMSGGSRGGSGHGGYGGDRGWHGG